jgi:deoxyhypusine synthase
MDRRWSDPRLTSIASFRQRNITNASHQHERHSFYGKTLPALQCAGDACSAQAYKQFIDEGGKMLVSLAGAMSTAELGISLAEMIRQDKVHAISCTAANLEEDLFNLFAHKDYKVIADWRALSAQDEVDLQAAGFNRVTDTCIPETVMFHMQDWLTKYWVEQAEKGEGKFPYEYFFQVLDEPD